MSIIFSFDCCGRPGRLAIFSFDCGTLKDRHEFRMLSILNAMHFAHTFVFCS